MLLEHGGNVGGVKEHDSKEALVISFEEVVKLIDSLKDSLKNSYPELVEFLGEVPPKKVQEAEEKLGVRFPESYRKFLERYGCGAFVGCEIYGVGVPETGVPSVVWFTLSEREAGLVPPWMVIVCTESEYDFCLDTSTFDESGECRVVSWLPGRPLDKQPYEFIFESFADFLYEYLREAIRSGWWA